MGSEVRAFVKETCGQLRNSEDKADKDNRHQTRFVSSLESVV